MNNLDPFHVRTHFSEFEGKVTFLSIHSSCALQQYNMHNDNITIYMHNI